MRKSLLISFFLTFLLLLSPTEIHAKSTENKTSELYTINFDNVPIQEFIRFIGKISTINFIFNESDLNFNITIVSEDKTSLDNIMSALVQILRIHGLSITEDGQNLFIHQMNALKQIPAVISDLYPKDKAVSRFPIVTRLFTIKQSSPKAIVELLKPLLSSSSTIEVSMETMQIIVTDTQASINNIERFISSLDDAKIPFVTTNFTANNIEATKLVPMAEALIKPIQQETPLIMVAKPEINAIYICTTPFLTKKITDILEEIDSQQKSENQYFIYNIQHATEEQIRASLKTLADYLKKQNYPNKKLISSLESMKWIKSTNSLVFIANEQSLNELKNLLPTFDIHPENSKSPLNQTALSDDFLIYRPTNVEGELLKKNIQEVAKNFLASNLEDPTLIQSLESVKWMPESSVLILTSDQKNLPKVQKIVTNLDKQKSIAIYQSINIPVDKLKTSLKNIITHTEGPVADAVKNIETNKDNNTIIIYGSPKVTEEISALLGQLDKIKKENEMQSSVSIYKCKKIDADDLISIIQDATKEESGLISKSIKNLSSNKITNTISIYGSTQTIQKIESLLETLDQTVDTAQTSIYHPEFVSSVDLKNMLLQIASKSPTQIQTVIKNITVNSKNNTLVLFGDKSSILQVEALIKKMDHKGAAVSTFIYKPKHISAEDLHTQLDSLAKHMASQESTGIQSPLTNAIEKSVVLSSANSIQFIINPTDEPKLKELIESVDSADNTSKKKEKEGQDTFLVWTLHSASPNDLIDHIKEISKSSKDPSLVQAVATVRYVKSSHAIAFSGLPKALAKIKVMLEKLDPITKKQTKKPRPKPESTDTYKLYTPINISGARLIQLVQEFEQHLIASGVHNTEISKTIDHLSYLPQANEIVVSGKEKIIENVTVLLKKFDQFPKLESDSPDGHLAGSKNISTIDNIGFLVYKLRYQKGDKIVEALTNITDELQATADNKSSNLPLIHAIRSVKWIEPTNSLIGSGDPKVLTKVSQLIKSIDRPLEQIFIEILILQTNITDQLAFGLSWGTAGKFRDKLGWNTGVYPSSGGTSSPSIAGPLQVTNQAQTVDPASPDQFPSVTGGALEVMGDLITHKGTTYSTLGSLINSLKSVGNTTVVLTQKVVTQDNQTTKIFDGSNVPFTGSLVTTTGLSQTTNANLEYRNIGTTLAITPTVGDEGVINLDINLSISSEATSSSSSGGQAPSIKDINGIQTTMTTIQTKTQIQDKTFLMLGGSYRNNTTRAKYGVPCLGGLPIVGGAFSTVQKLDDKIGIIMFIRPQIIKSNEEYLKISKRQEQIFLNEQANTEELRHAFNLMLNENKNLDDDKSDDDDDDECEDEDDENNEDE